MSGSIQVLLKQLQGVHLELRKTDCLLQGFIFNYMGLNMRQKSCIFKLSPQEKPGS